MGEGRTRQMRAEGDGERTHPPMTTVLLRACMCSMYLCVVATVSGCEDRKAAMIRTGMTEQGIIAVMGSPSAVADEPSAMKAFLSRTEHGKCPKASVRVLYFDRWIRRDVSVGIGPDGRVLCREDFFGGGIY